MTEACDHDDDDDGVHKLGRRQLEADTARAFLKAVDKLRAWQLRVGVAHEGTVFSLLEDMPWEEAFEQPLARAFGEVLRPVAVKEVAAARAAIVALDEVINKDLDSHQKLAVKIAEEQAAALVADLSVTAKQAVRDVIARGIRLNLPNDAIARQIADIVGLNRRLANAVMTMRDRLEAGDMPTERIEKALRRYADKLRRARSRTIARTELQAAFNNARLSGWRQLARAGKLTSEAKRIWIAKDPCRLCTDLSMLDPVSIWEAFVDPVTSRAIMAPPAHPNCKCSMGLVNVGLGRKR